MISYEVKLNQLRATMAAEGIDLYVMVNSDPHQSEYIPDYWKGIEFLCGFRGEVATLFVTADDALLWTDSRFFISGAQQLKDTGVQLMKLKIDIDPLSWLDQKKTQWAADKGRDMVIGGDQRVIFGALRERVSVHADLIDSLWSKRPALPKNKVALYDVKYDGESAENKMSRILEATAHQPLLLSSLDDVAWTLNLRGSDIPCTPVFISYLLLSDDDKCLYIDPDKLTPKVTDYLSGIGVRTAPYEEVPLDIATPHSGNPVPLFKSIKNEVEIEGTRSAMLKDGIALTHFYYWLEQQLSGYEELTITSNGEIGFPTDVTELDCVAKLIALRKEQPLYCEESFPAIVAWGSHAAMPHYENCDKTNVPIMGNGLLLIDTGGQYLDGTTDITRTIGIGTVSAEEKRDYTLVLKGHIRLAQAVFPVGTRGDQLDALARYDLWRDGKTYRHGTSHGVGHYLGVHEGPQSVRMEHNPQPLLPGMIFSNEPAIYLGGQYGIRHENCVLVRHFETAKEAPSATPCDAAEQGDFLALETLTLCYFDTTCLDLSLLTADEVEWLNNYNKWVFDSIAPHLTDAAEKDWLSAKCQPIKL